MKGDKAAVQIQPKLIVPESLGDWETQLTSGIHPSTHSLLQQPLRKASLSAMLPFRSLQIHSVTLCSGSVGSYAVRLKEASGINWGRGQPIQ